MGKDVNSIFSMNGITEAKTELILNYMEGHDYELRMLNGELVRFDISEDAASAEPYSVKDALLAVAEWNQSLLDDTLQEMESADSYEVYCKTSEKYKAHLKDELMIDEIFTRRCILL